MSRAGSFRDLDAVLRDDLALDDIAYGRRPHGGDSALGLLYAMVDDTGVRVPRRRVARGRRFTRGLVVTTAAATMLGATGVAAAQPGGSDGFRFAIFGHQPNHARAADKSLSEARRSLTEGDPVGATKDLNKAGAELAKTRRDPGTTRLRDRATNLRERVTSLRQDEPAQPEGSDGRSTSGGQAQPSWPWSWGIPGGGPGWQPEQAPNTPYCLLIVCAEIPATDTPPSSNEPGPVEAGPTLFRKLPPKNETAQPQIRVTVPVEPLLRPLLQPLTEPLTGQPSGPSTPEPSSSVKSAKPSDSSSADPSSAESQSSGSSLKPSESTSSSGSSSPSSSGSSSSSSSPSEPSESSSESGSPTPSSSDSGGSR